jgi:hypothetical protein
MRYIASRSLEDITGLHAAFNHFREPQESFGDDPDWFDKAKNVWRKWYEDLVRKEQAGG